MDRLWRATTGRDITRAVVFEQAPINGANAQGETPLHAAIQREAPLGVVAELVRLGAQVNALTHLLRSPLFLAVGHPDPRVLELLLENGARVDGLRYQSAPLHAAVSLDDAERVDTLLAAGANPHLRNRDGQHAIDWWREQGREEALAAVARPKLSRPVLKAVRRA
jgi:ankyrin repeat protein